MTANHDKRKTDDVFLTEFASNNMRSFYMNNCQTRLAPDVTLFKRGAMTEVLSGVCLGYSIKTFTEKNVHKWKNVHGNNVH